MSAIPLRQRQRGASLITAVFIITAMALVAGIMVRLTANTAITSANEVLSAKALYAAESGIDRAAFAISKGATGCAQAFNNLSVADGWADVTVSCDLDLGVGKRVYNIVSTGKAGGTAASPVVQRELAVQFMP